MTDSAIPQQNAGEGESVVLVDDDHFLLDAYSTKLSHQGFSVHAFLGVDDALGALRQGLKPDVILFDLVMPGKDGFTLLSSIRDEKLAPGALLIALTNQMEDEERKKTEELGTSRYLVKASVIPSEVVNIVREELAKKK